MMDAFDLPVGYLWLIAGAILMALEAFGAPGIGLLFGGLAALVVGMLMQLDLLPASDFVLQFGLWFGLTAILALLLWKPLQRWRTQPGGTDAGFNNIVGDLAVVCDGELVRGSTGHVRWSGTIMLAEIDPIADAVRIEDGGKVEITQVKGNTLFVRPYGSRRMEEVI